VLGYFVTALVFRPADAQFSCWTSKGFFCRSLPKQGLEPFPSSYACYSNLMTSRIVCTYHIVGKGKFAGLTGINFGTLFSKNNLFYTVCYEMHITPFD